MSQSPAIIDYLENHPHLVPVCASWLFGLWDCQSGNTYDQVVALVQEGAQRDSLPLTLVAINDHKPAGMISLLDHDLDAKHSLSPWLASVYVHPFHRNLGIAGRLVKRLETEAQRLGYTELYLVTEELQSLYTKNGWQEIEQVRTHFGDAALMTKVLTQD